MSAVSTLNEIVFVTGGDAPMATTGTKNTKPPSARNTQTAAAALFAYKDIWPSRTAFEHKLQSPHLHPLSHSAHWQRDGSSWSIFNPLTGSSLRRDSYLLVSAGSNPAGEEPRFAPSGAMMNPYLWCAAGRAIP